MTDFFNNQQNPNMDENSQTVKVGDKDYSMEELADLVSKGQTYREVETKYNTKLDRLMPEYTKATQRLKEIEPKLGEYEGRIKEYESKLNPQNQQMSDDQKVAALEQAASLGLITVKTLEEKVQDIIDRRVSSLFTAKEKIGETQSVINQFQNDYGIEATTEDVLSFMAREGIKNPKYAMEEMFGERLEQIRTEKAKKAQEDEFVTQSSSTTGARQYRANIDYKNKGEVQKLLRESLRGEK